jgi:hypothetical protein
MIGNKKEFPIISRQEAFRLGALGKRSAPKGAALKNYMLQSARGYALAPLGSRWSENKNKK